MMIRLVEGRVSEAWEKRREVLVEISDGDGG